jgi:hypothetical protein
MGTRWVKRSVLAGAISVAAVLAASSSFAAKTQAFTGTVGDAACGAKHIMEGDDVSCLRSCVRKGSKYDLVVGDKFYVLDAKDDSTTDALDRLAGQQVTVKGEANGNVIEVKSVAAAN